MTHVEVDKVAGDPLRLGEALSQTTSEAARAWKWDASRARKV